jgi:hypothetical protein
VPDVRGWHIVLLLTAALALGWVVLASLVAPIRTSCDPVLTPGECRESVRAAMARGLPRPHGLLLAARVTAGPDRAPDQLGHRATVTFDILGAPAAVGVALHLDLGGHWGGVVDRDQLEVQAVPVVQSALIVVLGLGIAGLIRSVGRGRAPRQPDRRHMWNERT